MTEDDIPDRLSVFENSPFYSPMHSAVVVLLNGNKITGKRACVEYCISERWVKCCFINDGQVVKRANNTVPVFTLRGRVQVFRADKPFEEK